MTPPQGAAVEGTTDPSPAARLHGVATGDLAFRSVLSLAALAIPVLLGFLVWELVEGSRLAIGKFGLHFLTTSTWDPVANQFGAVPLIFGTLLSSFLALLFAVPLSLGVAIFLTEFAPAPIRRPIAFLIELLAAIPSVVYGLWGFYFLIPILRKTAFPFLKSSLGFLPLFQGPIYGSSMLAAGLILAIMVMPFVMSVSREVLATVPGSQREAALALGATRWEAAWTAVVPYARSGLVGAVILGLGRARGGAGGGVAHAIVGTLLIVGAACVIGLPIGIGAGIFAAEFAGTRLATVTRFVSDVLNGTPSIVVGVFAWRWIVAPQKHFSGLAGSAALALLMIPMVMRTTEEMIKLVPHSLREAALALGYARWRTSLSIVVRTCLPGIVTGALLAVARIAGETAPLILTALGSQFMSTNLRQPIAALPLVVYTYAIGPYDDWHRLAWATALVLILVVLVLSLAARLATRRRFDAR